jgi:two-component system phosphate regulon sensor histidine kinase PhoR
MFAASQYLVIDFSAKTASIIAELQTIILLFLLFSAIIIGVYAYTLRNFIRQRKLSELKTDFINNMTHEFKTPIASISLAADSLKNPKILQNPELILRYGEIIKEENRRMNRHIEAVLQSAILEKETLQLKREKLGVHTLLETAVDRVRFQQSEKEIRIAEEYEAADDRVFGDEMHLVNVFVNLLENAVKYCPTVPEIIIKTKNEDDKLIISVSDNGIGIKKEDLKEVFQKFYRVPTGNLHNVKGFGLGLHYVKSIVEMHGGEVKAESIFGKGSTFTVTLPLFKNEDNDHEHNKQE